MDKGAGEDGTDLVYLVTPNGANSTVSMLDVDSNGYVIGPNGTPATDYLPLFQPQVNAAGQMVGVTQNTASLNAIMQIPACMTIANDTSLTPKPAKRP